MRGDATKEVRGKGRAHVTGTSFLDPITEGIPSGMRNLLLEGDFHMKRMMLIAFLGRPCGVRLCRDDIRPDERVRHPASDRIGPDDKPRLWHWFIGDARHHSTATITVTASIGTVYNITLDAGTHFAGGTRNVQNGADAGRVHQSMTRQTL